MSRKTLLLMLFVIILTQTFAQKSVKPSRVNSSMFLVTTDSSCINYEVAKTVAEKLELKLYRKQSNTIFFEGETGFLSKYIAYFGSIPIEPDEEVILKLYNEEKYLKPKERVYLYGFSSMLGDGLKANRNYSRVLMSAYHQELNHVTNNELMSGSVLAQKERDVFMRRNWINIGYGMNYLTKDNPFYGSKDFAVGFGYVLEALHYVAIFGGPFMGKTSKDKVTLPMIGISSLVVWKWIFASMGKKHLRINSSIRNSGYSLPKTIEY